eukprot:GHVN01085459.1.p2 GENE.GHVN01085459.1~~GHVN01085459.1.p2  ORF type:complete len:103 (-),score=35.62 GHVN01085459.1:316-624(-)
MPSTDPFRNEMMKVVRPIKVGGNRDRGGTGTNSDDETHINLKTGTGSGSGERCEDEENVMRCIDWATMKDPGKRPSWEELLSQLTHRTQASTVSAVSEHAER